MKIFNELKRKLHYLIERIKLSESEYLSMKAKAQMYEAMMSTVVYSVDSEYQDVFDDVGNLITRIPKSRTATVHVNVTDMLAEGGIVFNKNVVKLDIAEFNGVKTL